MKFFFVLFVSMLLNSNIALAQEIRLALPDFNPWTVETNSNFSGIGVKKVVPILNASGVKYTFYSVPNYGKALKELQSGEVDGFFLASENNERNKVAVLSAPIAVNHWSWFVRADSTLNPESEKFKQTVTVGTHLNSNTHYWLQKQGYMTGAVYKKEVLPAMLLSSKRIDAVFLSSQVFTHDAKSISPKIAYTEIRETKINMGIYISKKYLKRYPDFMIRLNKTIKKYNTELKTD